MRVCICEACFACISSADVASVHGSGIGAFALLTQPSRLLRCLCFENARDFSISTQSCWLTVNAGHNTNDDDKQLLRVILCFFYLVFSVRTSMCVLLCLLEMATGFSVFRGSYKITYLWNQAEPVGSRVLRDFAVNNLIQVTRPLSRTAVALLPFV